MKNIIGIISSSISKRITVSDSDAQLFIDATFNYNQSQCNTINNFVISLKDNSLWSKLIVINPKVGGVNYRHKINLKDPRDLDAAYRYIYSGTWTHSMQGSRPTGNAYANTYLNLNTSGLNGNFSFGYYITVAPTAFGDIHGMGAHSGANNFVSLQHNTITQVIGQAYGGGVGGALTLTSPHNGFFAISVNGTEKKIYHKNTIVTTIANGTSVPTLNLYEGALNFGGNYYNGLKATYGTSFISTGLTEVEISSLQTIIIEFETALGRNV